jgi:nitrite reductase (NADH) small subunit/3-phenylpropionate/trans-cinnamate dioxygenase ferredoxin subunit
MPEFVTVAKVGDIPNGEGRAFEVDQQMVAIFNHDGVYYAIDDMCPHMGASLAAGFFEKSDCTVTCPWHAWRFDVRDGSWCDNRRLKVDIFRVRLSGDEIQVSTQNQTESGGPKTEEKSNRPAEDNDEE